MKQEPTFQRNNFTIFLKTCLSTMLIKQTKEKEVSVNYIRITKLFKDARMQKELDEKIDAYEKQLRSEYLKLMN